MGRKVEVLADVDMLVHAIRILRLKVEARIFLWLLGHTRRLLDLNVWDISAFLGIGLFSFSLFL